MVMVMTMPKKTMAKMTAMAEPVVAVAAVPAMPTVTASESLTGDGQRSGGQRQSSNRGGNDRLELRHGRLLLSWAEQGSLCDDPPLEARAAMQCDEDHASWRRSPDWYDPGSRGIFPSGAR